MSAPELTAPETAQAQPDDDNDFRRKLRYYGTKAVASIGAVLLVDTLGVSCGCSASKHGGKAHVGEPAEAVTPAVLTQQQVQFEQALNEHQPVTANP